jgi:hypothetical protein
MHRSIWVLLICSAPVGCRIEDHGNDDWDEYRHCGCDDEHDPKGSGGSTPGTGGAAATGNAAGGATRGGGGGREAPDSGQTASAGGGPFASPALTPCSKEADCAPGFNCDTTRGKCTPSDSETCPELSDEAVCGARSDCKVVYAGVSCSCGPDCHCVGGEAGCICESFEFFRCEPAAPR